MWLMMSCPEPSASMLWIRRRFSHVECAGDDDDVVIGPWCIGLLIVLLCIIIVLFNHPRTYPYVYRCLRLAPHTWRVWNVCATVECSLAQVKRTTIELVRNGCMWLGNTNHIKRVVRGRLVHLLPNSANYADESITRRNISKCLPPALNQHLVQRCQRGESHDHRSSHQPNR